LIRKQHPAFKKLFACTRKNEMQWNSDILRMTLLIREQSPELSKYISEMTVTIPVAADPQINATILEEYYQSLHVLLIKYRDSR
jgi:hypothetical protein